MSAGNNSRSDLSPRPTPEPGFQPENRQHSEATAQCGENNGRDEERLLTEMENCNRNVIKALEEALRFNNVVHLPEFDPDKTQLDASAWCTMSDLYLADNPLQGRQLINAISNALKGTASTWFFRVVYAGMTWEEFKELFIARFGITETAASTLININNGKPKEGETLGAYANRLMTLLNYRLQNLTVEQIAVAITVAHISQFDSNLLRSAFMSEIDSPQRLLQELQVITHLKRTQTEGVESQPSANKCRKRSQFINYYHGGNMGAKSKKSTY